MAQVVALVDRDEREGTVRRSTCALLTLARRFGDPVAVCATRPGDETIKVLGYHGATEIWYPDTAVVPSQRGSAKSPPVTETDLLAAVAQRLDPAAVLIASTPRNQETAARLAIRLDCGIITDAVDLLPGPDGEPVAIQRCLAGSYLVESTIIRGIPLITVRPEAAVPEPSPASPTLHTIAVATSEARAARIAATPKTRLGRPALDQADIVVAGGRGIGSRATFAVLAEIAEALGGAVAGSHTAAELGWIPPEARIGLTGKTVNPRLYLACGVSGSVRHRAGMQGAKTVVAIDDDPAAPIFQLADLGIVGDVRAILPALLAEIRSRTQTRARARADQEVSDPELQDPA
jgi:electron transfer flavoprotein alpha subunit